MFHIEELIEAIDKDLEDDRPVSGVGNPEGAKVIIQLAKEIREQVRREGLRGRAAEKKFYILFNEATDPRLSVSEHPYRFRD